MALETSAYFDVNLQTLANCKFFGPESCVFFIITARDTGGKWTAHVCRKQGSSREPLFSSDPRDTPEEACQHLHTRSAERVNDHITSYGFNTVPKPGETTTRSERKSARQERADIYPSDSSGNCVLTPESESDAESLSGRSDSSAGETKKLARTRQSRTQRGYKKTESPRAPHSLASVDDSASEESDADQYPPPPPPNRPPPAVAALGRRPLGRSRAAIAPTSPRSPIVSKGFVQTSQPPAPAGPAPVPQRVPQPIPPIPVRHQRACQPQHAFPSPLLSNNPEKRPVFMVALSISWVGHGTARALIQTVPSLQALQSHAVSFIRQNSGSFDHAPSTIRPMKANVRRAYINDNAYEMSSWPSDDVAKLLETMKISSLPLFDIEVETVTGATLIPRPPPVSATGSPSPNPHPSMPPTATRPTSLSSPPPPSNMAAWGSQTQQDKRRSVHY